MSIADYQIKKITREREVYFIECPNCKKTINGTSPKMLKNNIKIHNAFCGKKQ